MRALCVVELQGSHDAVEHLVRGSGNLPAFQAVVVVDADAGKEGNLLSAQPWNTALPAVGRQVDHLRRQSGPPRHQEFADLALGVHDAQRSTSGDPYG